jgi:hypothetical protein
MTTLQDHLVEIRKTFNEMELDYGERHIAVIEKHLNGAVGDAEDATKKFMEWALREKQEREAMNQPAVADTSLSVLADHIVFNITGHTDPRAVSYVEERLQKAVEHQVHGMKCPRCKWVYSLDSIAPPFPEPGEAKSYNPFQKELEARFPMPTAEDAIKAVRMLARTLVQAGAFGAFEGLKEDGISIRDGCADLLVGHRDTDAAKSIIGGGK